MATVNALSVALFNAAAGGYAAEMTANASGFANAVGPILEKDISTDALFVEHLLGNLGVASTSAVYAQAKAAVAGLVAAKGRAGAASDAVDFLKAQEGSTSAYATIAADFAAKVNKAAAFTTANATERDITKLVSAITGVDTDVLAINTAVAAQKAADDAAFAKAAADAAAALKAANDKATADATAAKAAADKAAADAATALKAVDNTTYASEQAAYDAALAKAAADAAALKVTTDAALAKAAADLAAANAAIEALKNPSGQTFNFTTRTDTLVGTAGNDTFNGASGTVADADTVVDSSSTDNDTLNITVAADYTPGNIAKVEHVNIAWDAYTSPTITLTNVTGAKDVTITSSKVGYLGDATVAGAKANNIIAGAGVTGAFTVTGATTGVVVDGGSSSSLSVTGTGVATIKAGASDTTVSSLGFRTSTVTGGAATTGFTLKDAGSTSSTTVISSSSATITKDTTLAGKISVDIANGKTITFAQTLENDLTVTGSGATATVAMGTASLDGLVINNSKTAGTLTVSSSATTAADVSKVSANLIKESGNVNGAFTVADGQNLQFSRTAGTTLINVTGSLGDSTESATVTLIGTTHADVRSTTMKTVNLVASAPNITGTDLTITSLKANGTAAGTINLTGTNDVVVTAMADAGTESGTLDASALVGKLTVGSVAADNNATIKLGALAGSVTTAAAYTASLVVVGQSNADTVTSHATTGTTTAVLGSGDNTVTADTITTGTLVVTSAEGDDTVTVNGATLTTGTVNLNLGNGTNTVTISDAAGVSHVNITTGTGDDTVELTGTSGADVYTINAGDGSDTLYISTEGTDLSSGTFSLTGFETIMIPADTIGTGFEAIFKSSVLSGKTYNILADGYDATTAFKVKGSSTTSTIDLSTLVIDQSIDAAISAVTIDASANTTTGQTIIGTKLADTIVGGGGNDTITAGNGADTITGGAGNDTINLAETTANQAIDTVVFNAVATNGQDTINGFKIGTDILNLIGGTETTVTTAAGAAAVDFFGTSLTAGAAAWIAGAGANTLTTHTADVVVISTSLSSRGDLSLATDGSELLKALSSTAAAATEITVDTTGDDFYVVAYQSGNAYLYQATNTGTGVIASEMTLIATLTGIAAGTLTAAAFTVAG